MKKRAVLLARKKMMKSGINHVCVQCQKKIVITTLNDVSMNVGENRKKKDHRVDSLKV